MTLRALAERELWARGDLSHLILAGGQRKAYDFVHEVHAREESAAPIVLNCRRGLGKTWLSGAVAWESALRGRDTFIAGPTEKQILGITEPVMTFLMDACPPDLRPARSDGGTLYRFKNAVLRVVGTKEAAANLRGFRASTILCDELALFDQPEYVIRDVLTPFFTGRDHPLFILTSTPPATTGPSFNPPAEQPERDRRYLCVPCTEDASFTPRERDKMLTVFRDESSVGWKREMLCHLIADPSRLAVPSFNANRDRVIAEVPRPDEFYAFLGADLGFIDASAVLFAYWDFSEQKLVVEDEIVRASLGTKDLVSKVKAKERALYGATSHYDKIRRWADATPRELADLRAEGLSFSAARKGDEAWDKWRGLAHLDSFIADDRVRIHPRCRSLIHSLDNAQKNKSGSDIQRGPDNEGQNPDDPILGHFDAGWALAYLCWQVRAYRLQNPFTENPSRAFSPRAPIGRNTPDASLAAGPVIRNVKLNTYKARF